MHYSSHYTKLLGTLPALCLALMLCAGALRAQSDPLVSMAESLKGNVVAIRAAFADGSEEQGFGFITGEQGGRLFIATAAHVVFSGRKASRIEVRFHNDVSWEAATYKAHWDQEDLALLEMSKPAWAGWRADCADFSPRNPQAVRFLGRYGSGQPRWVYPGPNGEVYELSGNIISFSINTILPGCSGAPLLNERGIIGMVINDDQADSRALRLSRIRELLSNEGQYPYFGLRESGGAPLPVPPPAGDTPSGMVRIPGGTFPMGSTDGNDDEKPVRTVTVGDFYLGKYEVTNEEYCAFLNEKGNQSEGVSEWINLSGVYHYDEKCRIIKEGSRFRVQSGYEKHPVIFVSWFGATAYIKWLSEKTGLAYRLPTEAEWEYAAGNGSKHTMYSWGNGPPSGKKGGNVADETAKKQFSDWTIFDSYTDGYVYPAPVGSFDPNEFGLFDMSGNVWEWCSDLYDRSYYGKSGNTNNPTGPASGSFRVFRGGSWCSSPQHVRVANRHNFTPSFRYRDLGFRLARSVK